ncbi:helix-turn-helix domain-containing protein [Methylobacterium sp. E-046]|uniref:helix-turn-helix domain-containing protein n=1 Tax=Methylobacterium sp. E-046 TaxID=2836576 RepID=UPI001FB93CF7|nr:helix-turn-helix transcriptional regulator [Methylobacterium sp. E-046]MCJ2098967.1 helix-turn-helix domain-containing protein [Methylobacterium sp. E-046]
MQSPIMHKADMSEPHERLRQARLRAGYKSAAEAARRLNVPYGTYSGHENGNRGFKREEYIRYARIFGVDTAWLLEGTGSLIPSDPTEIFCVWKLGNVGALPDGELDTSPAENDKDFVLRMSYFPEDCADVAVVGNNVRNFARKGWHLICEDAYFPLSDRHEKELCFCRLPDNKVFLYFIHKHKGNGVCDIETGNGDFMHDCVIVSASIVGMILPNIAVKSMLDIMALHSEKLMEMARGVLGDTININVGEAIDSNKFDWDRDGAIAARADEALEKHRRG